MKDSYRRNKVVFILPDLNTGGGERVAAELVRWYVNDGRDVMVLTAPETVPPDIANRVEAIDVQWKNRIRAIAKIASVMLKYRSSADFIAVLTGPILVCGILNILFRAKVVGYEHSDIVELYLSDASAQRRMLRTASAYIALNNITSTLVVSPYIIKKLIRAIPIQEPNIYVARNPVRPLFAKLRDNGVELRSCRCTAVHLYLIGRDSPVKRFDEALRVIVRCGIAGEVLIVSNTTPERKERLEKCCSDLITVSVVPEYASLRAFYTQSSILINASIVESYSLVMAEWLASGLSVVSWPSENLKKLWSGVDNCYFIDEMNPEVSLRRAVKQSIDRQYYEQPIRHIFPTIDDTASDVNHALEQDD